jgi:16S rRNA (uracil1498-N3)-methyltransferase
MVERYYAPELADGFAEYVLDGDEAHHLLRVRRGKIGDSAQLFNGKGLRANAKVVQVDRRTAHLELSDFHRSPPSIGLTLGSAPPKGERLLWMVEKCTELGVKTWTPVLSNRTVVHPGDAKIDKLRRKVIEACKQCGRDDLMDIGEPTPLADFLGARPENSVGWFLDPSGVRDPASVRPIWACVGPEGGWTADEITTARSRGWTIHALAGHVLRIETACLACAAASIV